MKSTILSSWSIEAGSICAHYSSKCLDLAFKRRIIHVLVNKCVVIGLILSCKLDLNGQCVPGLSTNNLILNSGFENSCAVNQIHLNPFLTNGCADHWRAAAGTPHLIASPFDDSVPPSSTGGNFYAVSLSNTYQGICFYKETIIQKLKNNFKLSPGQKYNLRLEYRTVAFSGTQLGPGPSSVPAEFKIYGATQYSPLLNGNYCGDPTSGNRELIGQASNLNPATWSSISFCDITVAQDQDHILIEPYIPHPVTAGVLIDNVQLWCQSSLDLNFTTTNSQWNSYSFFASAQGNNQVSVVSWNWDFGDGATSNIKTPNHEYQKPGNYVVKLIITDNLGCTKEVIKTILVYNQQSCDCPNTPGNFNVGLPTETNSIAIMPFGSGSSHNNAGKCISIKGELFFPKNFEFIDGEIRMHPGSRLLVITSNNDDFVLKLTGTTTTPQHSLNIHGCGVMWYGIDVYDNKIQVVNTKIADAEGAIRFDDNFSISTSLNISNSLFENNWVGLKIESSGSTIGSLESTISSNIFQGLGVMNAPFGPIASYSPILKPYAGIVIRNLQSLNLKGVKGFFKGQAVPPNIYRDMENGIVSYGSTIDVNFSTFQNLLKNSLNTVTPTGNGIFSRGIPLDKSFSQLDLGSSKACTFLNCTNAIQSNNSAIIAGCGIMDNCLNGIIVAEPKYNFISVSELNLDNIKSRGIKILNSSSSTNPSITITNNIIKMSNASIGLDISLTTKGMNVIDNVIEMKSNSLGYAVQTLNSRGINFNNNEVKLNSAYALGLSTRNSSSCIYQCNRVLGISTSPNFLPWHNAFAFGNNSNLTISCNSTDKTSQGFYFDGMNDLVNQFTKNQMYSHNKGLSYKDLNSTTGNQFYTSNQWFNTTGTSSFQAFHGGLSIGAQQSLYSVPSVTGFNPFPLQPSSGWFLNQGTQTSFCDASCDITPIPPSFGRLDSFVITQSFIGDGYYPASQYIAEKMLMYKLIEHPSLLAAPTAQTFYNNRLNTNAGKVTRIKYIYEHCNDPDTAIITTLIELKRHIDFISDTISILDGMIFDTSGTVADNYRSIRHSYLDTLKTLSLQNRVLENVLDSLCKMRTQFAKNILVTIAPSNVWEENDKYLWNVKLNRNSETIINGLKDTLTNIAIQCWGFGGDAVFMARSMVDTFSFRFDTCSAPISSRESANPVTSNTLRIYPNPSTNLIQVEGKEVQGAKIELMLMNGQILKQFDHVPTSQLSIDISDIPAGIYLIRVDNSESGPVVQKFIKQ